jgi:transcriptional regulator with XRE-family HTH domain
MSSEGDKRPRDPEQAAYGRHMRSLRTARGLSQEQLADRSHLAADTVRRLECGSFSPSLNTLRRIAKGLGITVATMFQSFEDPRDDEIREIVVLLRGRSPTEIKIVTAVVRALLGELPTLGRH